MTNKIEGKHYFFAAFLNPFKSPNRICIATSVSDEFKERAIKTFDADPSDDMPKIFSNQIFRPLIFFILYVLCLVTIIPLIVLLIKAKPILDEVQKKVDAFYTASQNPSSSKPSLPNTPTP